MKYRTQPPWEFLLSASRNSLQSYELSRLSHAANLRKEITQLLDSWLEENTAAMLARWLMEQRGRSAEVPVESEPAVRTQEAIGSGEAHGRKGQVVSDNFFADGASSSSGFRPRS